MSVDVDGDGWLRSVATCARHATNPERQYHVEVACGVRRAARVRMGGGAPHPPGGSRTSC
jgi:hypothetical protein